MHEVHLETLFLYLESYELNRYQQNVFPSSPSNNAANSSQSSCHPSHSWSISSFVIPNHIRGIEV